MTDILHPETAPPRAEIEAILRGQQADPFRYLGMHLLDGKGPLVVNVFAPDATEVTVTDHKGKPKATLERIDPEGLFHGIVPKTKKAFPYKLSFKNFAGHEWSLYDAYSFGPVLGEMDEYLLGEGRHEELYRRLGAHPMTHEGVDGTAFAVWAPNARRVSVVGHFNAWDGRRHAMRKRGATGVWEIFVPGIGAGETYKYEIVGAYGNLQPLKADPVGFAAEKPPEQASVVHGLPRHEWTDGGWIEARSADQSAAPVSIYEVHLGSWRRSADGRDAGLRHARRRADRATSPRWASPMSSSCRSPSIRSRGPGAISRSACSRPTSRFGSPEEFARMVDRLHNAGIGVIVDWVPAHFPTDAHGLGVFDGTALYEHADPRQGFHKDWNTLIYNFGRAEVANFLRASATFWLKEYHIDALRVDAVASMLYLDYSRNEGEWIPNRYGGRENLDAIEFLKGTNSVVRQYVPGALTIAEESTAWPGVSRPVEEGGLGFDFKWNMGWMHDTLEYMQKDPT